MEVAFLDLGNAHALALFGEFLAVGVDNFIRRAVGDERTDGEELLGEFFRVHAGHSAEPGEHLAVENVGGGRGQAKRVGYDAGAKAHRHAGRRHQAAVEEFPADERAG